MSYIHGAGKLWETFSNCFCCNSQKEKEESDYVVKKILHVLGGSFNRRK